MKKRRQKPSDKRREKATRSTVNLLPYLKAASFVKLVLESVKLLIELRRTR